MNTRYFLISLLCLVNTASFAQDAYHSNLQSSLQSGYGLPAGNWVLPGNETATYAADYTWGDATSSTQSATGQDFSQKVHLTVSAAGSPQWASGYAISNVNPIGSGSACLLVIWLRAVNGPGKVSLFIENSSTYEKEVYLTFDVTEEWTQYLVPFEAGQAYGAGGLNTGMHIAWLAQEIELGGLAMLDYGTSVSVDDLPNQVNNDHYGGWEPDAPWRAEAAQRIDSLRKANLTVRVVDAGGSPLQDVPVQVEMLQHEFAFGSAVVASLFAGNHNQNDTYESKLSDLDGQGHGFNWVVFENALKWPAWENGWTASKTEVANATQWLVNHDIKVRGHNLVWPGLNHLPNDVAANITDVGFVKNRIFNHIEEITTWPGIAGNIAEWDVLNEITTNRDLEFAFQGQPGYPTGREIYPEIFDKLSEVDPATDLWLNDYVTIGQNNTGGGLYDTLKQFTQEIVNAGVPLDGIGFQSHLGGFPPSIYDVKDVLDDYSNTFGTAAKVTEYDISSEVSDPLAATYLRDYLTMIFSHPSMDGFMMWGFWDGAHWHNNAPLFYQDWSLKPSGQTFVDMVFNEWWTSENGQTDANGEYFVRGFKGKYKVTITCADTLIVDTVQMSGDLLLARVCDAVNAAEEPSRNGSIRIFPDPVSGHFTVQFDFKDPQMASLTLLNSQGIALRQWEREAVFKNTMIVDMTGLPPGIYLLQARTDVETRIFTISKL